MKTLLKNADIITVNEKYQVLKGYDILIENDIIQDIEPSIDMSLRGSEQRSNLIFDRNEKEEIIDCTNKIVMPGFINCHTHSPMTLFRSFADDMKLQDWLFNVTFPMEQNLTPEMCYAASKLSILEMIKTGTTTFNDMYFFMESVKQAVEDSKIRAFLSVSSNNKMDENLRNSKALYETGKSELINILFAPHSIYTCTKEHLESIIINSHKLESHIHIHLSETKKEVEDCIREHGVTPVKYLEGLGMFERPVIAAHCVHITDEDIEILKKYNVSVAHNPASNMKLASGIAPIDKLIKAGVNVCLGTDGAGSNNNLDMLKELRLASYLQKVNTYDPTVFPVDTALSVATVNGAKALGIEKLGQVKEGYKADLIIIDTNKSYYYPRTNIKNQIVYSGNAEDIDTVIINGKIVMRNREVLTMDEEKVKFEAQKAFEQLVKGVM